MYVRIYLVNVTFLWYIIFFYNGKRDRIIFNLTSSLVKGALWKIPKRACYLPAAVCLLNQEGSWRLEESVIKCTFMMTAPRVCWDKECLSCISRVKKKSILLRELFLNAPWRRHIRRDRGGILSGHQVKN